VCTVMRAAFDSPRVLFELSVVELGRVKVHFEGGRAEVSATGDFMPASLGMVVNAKDKMLGQFTVNYDDLSEKTPQIQYWTGDAQFQLRLPEGGGGTRAGNDARKYKVLNLKSLRVFEKVGSLDTANLYATCKAYNGPPFRISLYPVYGSDTGPGKEPINFDGKQFVRIYEDYGAIGCSLFSGSAAPPLEKIKVGFGPVLYSMSIAADARPLGSFVIDYHDTVRRGSVYHYFTGIINLELELVDTNESEKEAADKAAAAEWKDVTLQGIRVFNDEELTGDLELYATCSFSGTAPPIRIDFANVRSSTRGKLIRPGETCRGPYCEGLDGAMPFVRWQRSYGEHMKCAVVERDPEPAANNYALSLTELAKIRVAVGSRDTILGEFIVHYADLGTKAAPRERAYWTGDAELVLSLHKQSAAADRAEMDGIAKSATPEYKELLLDSFTTTGEHGSSKHLYVVCDYPGAGETRVNLPPAGGAGQRVTFANEHQPGVTSRPFARFYRSYGAAMSCAIAQRVSKLPIKHFSGGVVINEEVSAGVHFARERNGDATVGVDVTITDESTGNKPLDIKPVSMSIGAEDPVLGSFVINYDDFSGDVVTSRTYWVGEAELRISLAKIANVGGRFEPTNDVVPRTGEGEEPQEDEEEALALAGQEHGEIKADEARLDEIRAEEGSLRAEGSTGTGTGADGDSSAASVAAQSASQAHGLVGAQHSRQLAADQARVAAIIDEEKSTRDLQAVDARLSAAEARERLSGATVGNQDPVGLESGAGTGAGTGTGTGAGNVANDLLLSSTRKGMGAGNNGERVTPYAVDAEYTGAAAGADQDQQGAAHGVRHLSLETINVVNARESFGKADIYMMCTFEHGAQTRISLPTKVSAEGKEAAVHKPLFSYYGAYGRYAKCMLLNSQGDPPINDVRVGVKGGSASVTVGKRDMLLGSVVIAFDDFGATQDTTREYWFGDASIVLRSWNDLAASPFVATAGEAGSPPSSAASTPAPGPESRAASDAEAQPFVELRADAVLLRETAESLGDDPEVYLDCQASFASPAFRINIPSISKNDRVDFGRPLFRFYRSYGDRLHCSIWEADGESLLSHANAQYSVAGLGTATVSTNLADDGTRTIAAGYDGKFVDPRDAAAAEAPSHKVRAALSFNNGDDFLGSISIGYDDFLGTEARTYDAASIAVTVSLVAHNMPASHAAPRRDLVLEAVTVTHDGEAESSPEIELRCGDAASGRPWSSLVFPARDIRGKKEHELGYALGSIYPGGEPLFCTVREIDEAGNVKSFAVEYDGYKISHAEGLLDFTVPQLHDHSLLKGKKAGLGIPYEFSAANLGDFFLAYADFGAGRETVTVWTGSVELKIRWVDHAVATENGARGEGGSIEEAVTAAGAAGASGSSATVIDTSAGTEATEGTDAAVEVVATSGDVLIAGPEEDAIRDAMDAQNQDQRSAEQASETVDEMQARPVQVGNANSNNGNNNNANSNNGNNNNNANNNNHNNNNGNNDGVSNDEAQAQADEAEAHAREAEANTAVVASDAAPAASAATAAGSTTPPAADGHANGGAATPAETPASEQQQQEQQQQQDLAQQEQMQHEQEGGHQQSPGEDAAKGKWVWLKSVRALTFKDKFLSALNGVEIALVCQFDKYPSLPITFLVEVPRAESKGAKLFNVDKPLFIHQEAYGGSLSCQVVETDGSSKFKAIHLEIPHAGEQKVNVIELKDAKLGSFKLEISALSAEPLIVGTTDVEFSLAIVEAGQQGQQSQDQQQVDGQQQQQHQDGEQLQHTEESSTGQETQVNESSTGTAAESLSPAEAVAADHARTEALFSQTAEGSQ
jgi:hypothetical protein